MRRPISSLGLGSLIAVSVVEVCTAAIARPIDGEVEFAEYLGLLAVGWAAICAFGCIKKRDDVLAHLLKRDTLTCAVSEQCLSYKGDPFCFNRANWTFHTADGTTGSFETGVYTLPDGQVGNMYHGPYPSETGPPVTAPAAAPTGASVTVITSVEIVSSAGAPAGGAGGPTAGATGVSSPVASVLPSSTPKSGAATGGLGARAALEGLAIALLGLVFLAYL